ncbi:P-loop containing nucleoside triphosphate hydrolase protein [Flagelloscypha sp. PMI_526]|nr:P-loop containing nucleoside triphosphate hydrolase protein [Flagelloscypha sp. PMI_526]
MTGHKRKLLIVGDETVGKTSLLARFTRGEFQEGRASFGSEDPVPFIQVDQKRVELNLWVRPGSGEPVNWYHLLAYPSTNVVLIAFSVDDPNSLDNVQEKWIREVRHFLSEVLVILVGCKNDLRNNEKGLAELAGIRLRPTTFDEGLAVALNIGADQFFECSAKTGEGVAEIFQVAARGAMEQRTGSRRKAGSSCVVC